MSRRRSLVVFALLAVLFWIRTVALIYWLPLDLVDKYEHHRLQLALEILSDSSVSPREYVYPGHSGGQLAVAYALVPFVLVFGPKVLAAKAFAATLSFAVLSTWFWFLVRHHSLRAAGFFGIFFVAGPISFTTVSLIPLGAHFDTTLFMILALAWGRRVLGLAPASAGRPVAAWELIAFAAFLGLATAFSLTFLLSVAALLLIAFRAVRRFLVSRRIAWLALGFAIGLAPIPLLGPTCGDSGRASFLAVRKPLPGGWELFLRKLGGLVIRQFPLSLRFDPVGTWCFAPVFALLVLAFAWERRGALAAFARAFLPVRRCRSMAAGEAADLYMLLVPALLAVVYSLFNFAIEGPVSVRYRYLSVAYVPLAAAASMTLAGIRDRCLAGFLFALLAVPGVMNNALLPDPGGAGLASRADPGIPSSLVAAVSIYSSGDPARLEETLTGRPEPGRTLLSQLCRRNIAMRAARSADSPGSFPPAGGLEPRGEEAIWFMIGLCRPAGGKLDPQVPHRLTEEFWGGDRTEAPGPAGFRRGIAAGLLWGGIVARKDVEELLRFIQAFPEDDRPILWETMGCHAPERPERTEDPVGVARGRFTPRLPVEAGIPFYHGLGRFSGQQFYLTLSDRLLARPPEIAEDLAAAFYRGVGRAFALHYGTVPPVCLRYVDAVPPEWREEVLIGIGIELALDVGYGNLVECGFLDRYPGDVARGAHGVKEGRRGY
ncbi:MAG: hypothetical protein HY720_11945 [Planctomycetes bacterium]|nr:hypothetical protein [Planctomycetota bacterium]